MGEGDGWSEGDSLCELVWAAAVLMLRDDVELEWADMDGSEASSMPGPGERPGRAGEDDDVVFVPLCVVDNVGLDGCAMTESRAHCC